MGLAEPGRAVEEERVVGLAGGLGDGERGGVGEAVAGTDHEAVEGVVAVERQRLGRAWSARRPRGIGVDEGHVGQGRRPAAQRRDEPRRVAALDPGANGGGRGDEQGRALRRDRLHRLQPEAEGGRGQRPAKLVGTPSQSCSRSASGGSAGTAGDHTIGRRAPLRATPQYAGNEAGAASSRRRSVEEPRL